MTTKKSDDDKPGASADKNPHIGDLNLDGSPAAGAPASKARKPGEAPTVDPDLQVAEPEPDQFLFDPSRPEANESIRHQLARAAWQHRQRVAHEALRVATLAREAVEHARHGGMQTVEEAEAAAKKAEEEHRKLAAEVAPQPEPWDLDDHEQETRRGKRPAEDSAAGIGSTHTKDYAPYFKRVMYVDSR
jgi:hypothetical protein